MLLEDKLEDHQVITMHTEENMDSFANFVMIHPVADILVSSKIPVHSISRAMQ